MEGQWGMGTPTSLTFSNRAVEKSTVEKDTVFWDRNLTGFGVQVYPVARQRRACVLHVLHMCHLSDLVEA